MLLLEPVIDTFVKRLVLTGFRVAMHNQSKSLGWLTKTSINLLQITKHYKLKF